MEHDFSLPKDRFTVGRISYSRDDSVEFYLSAISMGMRKEDGVYSVYSAPRFNDVIDFGYGKHALIVEKNSMLSPHKITMKPLRNFDISHEVKEGMELSIKYQAIMDNKTEKTEPATPAVVKSEAKVANPVKLKTEAQIAAASKKALAKKEAKARKAAEAKADAVVPTESVDSKAGIPVLPAEPGNNKSVSDIGTVADLKTSKSFKDILSDLNEGKFVTLKEEKDRQFLLENGRLKRYDLNGVYIDSAPLFTFQEKSGWAVKK